MNTIRFVVECILSEFAPQRNSSEANNKGMLICYLFAIFACGKIHLLSILIRVSWSLGVVLAQILSLPFLDRFAEEKQGETFRKNSQFSRNFVLVSSISLH